MSIADDLIELKSSKEQADIINILTIDIETSPSLAYIWSCWKENIPLARLLEEGQVISFAAKWLGNDEVMFYSDYHDGHEAMISAAWDLLDQADVLVHFNGKRFDVPHLNREFLLAGFPPPSPFKEIDLLTVVRSRFKFVSNKLEHVLDVCGLTQKVDHIGFSMWKDCLLGEGDVQRTAWEDMRFYNMGDVVSEEELYLHVRPWIKGHPVVTPITTEDELRCTRCGSANVSPSNKMVATPTIEYPLYECLNCHGHLLGREGVRISNLRSV